MGYDLAGYQPVEDRLRDFWAQWPLGRIVTDLVAYSDQAFIVRAEVYRTDQDPAAAATGYAEERVGSNPVNRTSALENCETSAVGRALANLGFAPKGARPSREEMAKTKRYAADHRALAADTQQVDRAKVARGPAPDDPWQGTSNPGEAQAAAAREAVLAAADQARGMAIVGDAPATRAQLGKIGALMTGVRLTDRAEALAYVNSVLGLPAGTVRSRTDLTKAQASKVIEALNDAAKVVDQL